MLEDAYAAKAYQLSKALSNAALLATLPLPGSSLVAKGDGVKLSDLTISMGAPNTVTSVSAAWTAADVGKIISVRGAGTAAGGVTNGQAFGASVAPLFATITAVNNTNSVQVSVAASQAVTGVTGAYGTDDTNAVRALHLVASATGRAIVYPTGVYCVARPIDFLANTTVTCYGEIFMFADPTNAGGFLIIKAGDDNINWFGGVINGGDLTNMNGIAAAYDPVGGVFSKNITFRPTLVTGCRMNLAMHAASAFSGGGKGVTGQFDLDGMLIECTISDCDIGLTIEGAQANNQLTYNVRGRFVIKNCPYAAGVFAGSVPSGDGSTTLAGDASTRYGQADVEVRVDNCGTIAAIGTICSPFWGNWPSFLRLRAFVSSAVSTNFVLWKGNVGHGCDITIGAATDTLADAVDLSPFTGASLSAFTSYGGSIRLVLEGRTTPTGSIFRGVGGGLESRMRLEADYLYPSAPSTIFANISNSATMTYKLFNRFLGQAREGQTSVSLSNLNGDPYRLDYLYVTFGKIVAYQPSATAPAVIPAGTQVALADGMVAGSDGTVQSNGWGAAGPGQYIARTLSIAGSGSSSVATVQWGRPQLDAPPLDYASSATLTSAQAGLILTNNAAGARVDLTLPTPVANNRGALIFKAVVIAAVGIRLVAPAGVTIIIPGIGSSTAGGYAQCTTVGGNLELTALSATVYIATGGMSAGWSVA